MAGGWMIPSFQFHKGTIKTPLTLRKRRVLTTFQFHKGTIKTFRRRHSEICLLQVFQFHKGTIKTSGGCEGARRWLDFNSIKVRLKREVPYLTKRLINVFQFHKGTIKTLISRLLPRYSG